jgi:arylsulfatase A-like enzyme
MDDRDFPPNGPSGTQEEVSGSMIAAQNEGLEPLGSPGPGVARDRIRWLSLEEWGERFPILLPAAWFGLAAGLLELVLLVIRVKVIEKGVFLRSTHFLWMVPVSDIAIFLTSGLALSLLSRAWPTRGSRLFVGVFIFLAVLSQLLLVRGLHILACVVMAAGCARIATPLIFAQQQGFVRWAKRTTPVLLGALIVLVGLAFARETFAGRHARVSRQVPPPGAMNVLLIVLDTVRANRLSLYGYDRETTPNLSLLAKDGVRFDRVHSTAPWTLPSHASIFTGRWPHELDVEGRGGLDTTYSTLAEFLRDQGYATAGVVANQFYCGHESGLDRGFDDYRDYSVTPGEIFRSSSLGWLLSRNFNRFRDELIHRLHVDSGVGLSQDFQRKDAESVNREFLDWLAVRGDRPYFAFLNYFDAHAPYVVPQGIRRHFGMVPKSRDEKILLRDSWKRSEKPYSPDELKLLSDSYDDCIASLDQDIGQLFGELTRRGLLERTIVIVTADHGEEFGEHGHFQHGFSLYEPATHVPLLIVAPPRVPRGRVVRDSVSLRDIPATVADLLGRRDESPFPGTSLARTWEDQGIEGRSAAELPISELRSLIEPTLERPNNLDSPTPSTSLFDENFAYINSQNGREELYDLDHDPRQSLDLSKLPASEPILARFRRSLKANPAASPEPDRQGSGQTKAPGHPQKEQKGHSGLAQDRFRGGGSNPNTVE